MNREKQSPTSKNLKDVIQAQNMKINKAKWAKHLRDRGLLPYCNAPYPKE